MNPKILIGAGVGVMVALEGAMATWWMLNGDLPISFLFFQLPIMGIAMGMMLWGFISVADTRLARGRHFAGRIRLADPRGAKRRNVFTRQKNARDAEIARLSRVVSQLQRDCAQVKETLAVISSPNVVDLDLVRSLHAIDDKLSEDHR